MPYGFKTCFGNDCCYELIFCIAKVYKNKLCGVNGSDRYDADEYYDNDGRDA